MNATPELIIPSDVIQQQIDYAEKKRKQWIRSLADLHKLDKGRMRINGVWETTEQAAARIQELIDIHARIVELVSGFQIKEAPDQSA